MAGHRNLKIHAVIQARSSSTRLPGKVLMPLPAAFHEKPLLWHIVKRCRSVAYVDQVIVATSHDPSDDDLARQLKAWNVVCVRGSLDDVLERYHRAAQLFPADAYLRVTGDNPLVSIEHMRLLCQLQQNQPLDYRTVAGLPLGLGTELISDRALQLCYQQAKAPQHREHVTPYIYTHPELFSICKTHIKNWENLHNWRLTVDSQEDLLLVRKIYQDAYKKGIRIVRPIKLKKLRRWLLRNHNLQQINQHVEQRDWKNCYNSSRHT